jgi:hypothetical protein
MAQNDDPNALLDLAPLMLQTLRRRGADEILKFLR